VVRCFIIDDGLAEIRQRLPIKVELVFQVLFQRNYALETFGLADPHGARLTNTIREYAFENKVFEVGVLAENDFSFAVELMVFEASLVVILVVLLFTDEITFTLSSVIFPVTVIFTIY
jgi:hypothetical protein